MQTIKIRRKKGDICPVCQKIMWGKNYWVIYHIRYSPPIVILACRYCNYTEWAVRNDKINRIERADPTRIHMVKNLMFKYNILKK